MSDTSSEKQFQRTVEAMNEACERLRLGAEGTSAAVRRLNAAIDEMRREHPEWFDPQTGYLIERDV